VGCFGFCYGVLDIIRSDLNAGFALAFWYGIGMGSDLKWRFGRGVELWFMYMYII
jgi:hypothetical protein